MNSGLKGIPNHNIGLGNVAAETLAVHNSVTVGATPTAVVPSPTTLKVYNTYLNDANYERGVIDWSTTANNLSIGSQAAGTGTLRNTTILTGTTLTLFINNGSIPITHPGGGQLVVNGVFLFGGAQVGMNSGMALNWSSHGINPAGVSAQDVGINRAAAKVNSFTDGTTTAAGWFQWAGQKRVTSDFDTGNSTTLANITGLSATVQAGRTYSFEAVIPTASDVAAGVKFAIAGTATATSIFYEGLLYSGAAVVAQTRSAALAGTVGAVTAVTAALCKISGTITVNAAGTLTVQMAQNVGNAVGSVALRGSYFIVQDMP